MMPEGQEAAATKHHESVSGRTTRVSTIDTKWGGAVRPGISGYQILPNVLLRKQKLLKLDATDVVILLNICLHWWESEPEKMPHPRPVTIAKRMGVTTRTVERRIAKIQRLGLLVWNPSEARADGPNIRNFDMRRLRSALQRLASESDAEEGID
jgi:hypothetical protein